MDNTIRKRGTLVHWFRYDLRLHDMPSLTASLNFCSTLYPVYIFDEDIVITEKCGYNRLRFILDALKDINDKLKKINGRLYVFHGNPFVILSDLFKQWNVTHFSYEHDIQPSWKKTEIFIQDICRKNNIEIINEVSRTLWKTEDILALNGGTPPVTYNVFCHVAEILGPPSRPEPDVNFEGIVIPSIAMSVSDLPSCPEELGVQMECEEQKNKVWVGGETHALQHLKERLKIEEAAYTVGYFMPNQLQPDLLGPPMSMSAALSFGCLSVRRFYWSIRDLYKTIQPEEFIPDGLVGQLIWREYFYAMCMNNPHYGSMKENPICLNIPWATDKKLLQCWAEGKTGFPFIDAAMRQLRQEGWIHHVARNAVACFLTRGDLWISWEEGLKIFMKYLLDADLPICAGNWMWVSSSAFETILQCSACISPISYGRRFEPSGEYIRKYVPELKNMPQNFLFQPWLAPLSVQESAGCIIGSDYPYPVVDHQEASVRNCQKMSLVKEKFLPKDIPRHCAPSNTAEIRFFMCLPSKCIQNLAHG